MNIKLNGGAQIIVHVWEMYNILVLFKRYTRFLVRILTAYILHSTCACPVWNWNLRGISLFKKPPENGLEENMQKQYRQEGYVQVIVYLEGYGFGYKAKCQRFDRAEFSNAVSG